MINLTTQFGTHIVTTMKEFLVQEQCPVTWRGMDLYIIRDDQSTFYIGQSTSAYDRIWQHLIDGYKGRSTIGRFILCNWRGSMDFTIELFSSLMPCFYEFHNSPNEIERFLIEQSSPCFNNALNKYPAPLPEYYIPPNQAIQHARSIKKMILEAGYVLKAEKRKTWKDQLV